MFRFPFPRRSPKQAPAEPPEPDPQWCLEQVVDSLRLAALPAEQQIAVLPDFVHVPQEVSLLYDDALMLVPWIREAGLITDEQEEALARLRRLHIEMAAAIDNDLLWTVEAMRSDERWEQGRGLATEALAALGRDLGRPSLGDTTWVSASETRTLEPPK
jgi:hypothetical protein